MVLHVKTNANKKVKLSMKIKNNTLSQIQLHKKNLPYFAWGLFKKKKKSMKKQLYEY